MARRNQEQKLKRNATRRDNSKRNRKAVFCLNHLRITRPEIYEEAMELYEHVNAIYPCKHDLTQTVLYRKTIEGGNVPLRTSIRTSIRTSVRTSKREVTPRLEIPLVVMQDQVEVPRQNHQSVITSTVSSEEIESIMKDLQQDPSSTVSSEEIESAMKDLQQDPDLRNFFNEIAVVSDESGPKTLEEEIDSIIKAEFQRLDMELQDLIGC